MGPVNLGIKLYDGNSSHFCLCASLYSKFELSGDFNESVLNISTTLYQNLHGILCSFNLN